MIQGGSASTCRCDASTQNTSPKRPISESARTWVRPQRHRFASRREQPARALQEVLNVELRSHLDVARQPRSPRSGHSHDRLAGTARKAPLGPEAAGLLVNPACSLAPGPFGTINAAHRQLPPRHSPPSIAAISSPLRHPRLDPGAAPASTTVSRWPSWPCSSWSQRRRSRYLPFKPQSRTGTAAAPRGGGPEVFFVVHVPVALPAFIAGRS